MIAAPDFFTVEVWTPWGLQRFIVLFFIELSTRRVEVGGIASAANGLWMSQIGRNLTDVADDGILSGKRYLIHHRDPLFTAEFLGTLAASGLRSVQLPPRSPNLNAHAERFVRSIKESCLDRMILFREGSLRKAIREFPFIIMASAITKGSAIVSSSGTDLMRESVEPSGAASGWAGC